MRRVATIVTFAAAAVSLWASSASGHAAIEHTDPADGAVLQDAPGEIRLAFTEPPDLGLTQIGVLDRTATPVPTGPPRLVPGGDREIRVPLEPLPNGVYTVTWRTVSRTDGHLTSNAFTFGVGVAPEEVAPSAGRGDVTAPPTPLAVAGRWGVYVGLVLLFGAAIAGLLAIGPAAVARPWLFGVGWALAAVGVVVMTIEERGAVGVPLGRLLGSDAGGAFVRLAVAIGVAGVTALVAALRPTRWSLIALAATAGAAMLARAEGGHAGSSAQSVAEQWLHMAGAGAWIGGLAWFALALRRGLEPAQVRRFSNLAAGGLAVLLLSGLLRSSDELGLTWWLDPFENGYTTALVVKLGLVTPLVALGAMNRLRNVRRFERADERPLLRTVGGELALAAAVFATTGVLTGLPPQGLGGAGEETPPPIVVTGSDFATTIKVRLRISPGTVGPNTFTAEVVDYDTRAPVQATRVSLGFELPARPELGSTLRLEPAGDAWVAQGTALAVAGAWDVRVLVERADGSVEVPLRVRPRVPGQRVEVSRVEGQPDLYTIHLEDGVQIQSYVDPGEAGRINQVHVTAFDAEGTELPLEGAVLTLSPPGGTAFEPELLRFGEAGGHFVANVELEPGTWSFDVVAETTGGETLAASFQQTFEG